MVTTAGMYHTFMHSIKHATLRDPTELSRGIPGGFLTAPLFFVDRDFLKNMTFVRRKKHFHPLYCIKSPHTKNISFHWALCNVHKAPLFAR